MYNHKLWTLTHHRVPSYELLPPQLSPPKFEPILTNHDRALRNKVYATEIVNRALRKKLTCAVSSPHIPSSARETKGKTPPAVAFTRTSSLRVRLCTVRPGGVEAGLGWRASEGTGEPHAPPPRPREYGGTADLEAVENGSQLGGGG
jgi:hypothetical protein